MRFLTRDGRVHVHVAYYLLVNYFYPDEWVTPELRRAYFRDPNRQRGWYANLRTALGDV